MAIGRTGQGTMDMPILLALMSVSVESDHTIAGDKLRGKDEGPYRPALRARAVPRGLVFPLSRGEWWARRVRHALNAPCPVAPQRATLMAMRRPSSFLPYAAVRVLDLEPLFDLAK